MPYSSCSVVARGALSLRHLAVAAVQLPALICLEAMLWAVAFLTFPLRVLAAADRERKLDRLLGEMQGQMERVVRENGDLQQKLRAALKEQAAMEEILDEMEEEQEDAFARIDLLESQVRALKKENTRLNEHKGKSMWDKAAAVAGQAVVTGGGEAEDDKHAAKSWDIAGEDEKEVAVVLSGTSPPSILDLEAVEREARRMEVAARRRSLFSVGMSLAVGGIAWSADAPCLPLLAGLLTVVGMSMCSVARLFRARRPLAPAASGSGAVALLSLNWFLLGVLTYPMLPGVARVVVPRAARLAGPAIAWFAVAAPV
ncbi:hypothetical protein QYE76_058798 [Lolium multiflorum]|uniref:Uncharacterized protein n=1 Tax=Lolium multiflorum TaxID=4521 RepID=A0AAD8T6Y9_LOLMU|nr:hypothetical protein QYE76_058798 [Lolium multiflorum]